MKTSILLDIVEQVGSKEAADAFRQPAENVIEQRGGAGALFGIGLAGALWSASGYVGALTRANNEIWEVREGRPFWKLKPLQMLVTIVVVLGVALIAIGIAVSGPVAVKVGDALGAGSTGVWLWQVGKWPVMLGGVALIVALLYYATPNVDQPRLRWISPGAVVAMGVWLVASAGFATYVANLGNYNAT